MEKEIQRKSADRFFRQEYRKLVELARKQLESRFVEATPEDIVQDVALGLIQRLDLDAQIGNMAGYIYRALRNRILDLRRKKQRNVSLDHYRDKKTGNHLSRILADEGPTEVTAYETIEPETLRKAIAQLRPDEQAIIIATVFEQRTYEEVSEEWEVPVGTLLSRKHRALSKLHKILTNKNSQEYGNNGSARKK